MGHDLAFDQRLEQVTQRGHCLTDGAASSRVDASIHAATWTGWTAVIDGTSILAHQARNPFWAR